MDEYYLKSGLEFVAYENWKKADEQLQNAQGALEEANMDMPLLQEEYDHAKYELDRATNREEYEYARQIFDEVKERKQDAQSKKDTA